MHASYLSMFNFGPNMDSPEKEAEGWLRANAEEINYYTCIDQ